MNQADFKAVLGTDWAKIVQRQESVLMIENLIAGVGVKRIGPVFGKGLGNDFYLYLDTNIYWSAEEAKRNIQALKKIVSEQGAGRLQGFLGIWEQQGEDLLSFSEKIAGMQLEKESNGALDRLFSKFSEKNAAFSSSLLLPLSAESVIEERLKGLLEKKGVSGEKVKDYFLTLTFPHKPDYSTKEMVSIYGIAAEIAENGAGLSSPPKKTAEAINAHIKEFGWINTRWYIGNAWRFEEIIGRLKLLIKEDCRAKLAAMESLAEENRKKTVEIMGELSFSREERALVELTKGFVHIRTFRTDTFNKAGFIARPLIKEIGKRFGFGFEEMIFLSVEEIIGLLQGKKIPKELPRQRATEGFGAIQFKGKVLLFTKEELRALKEKIEGPAQASQAKELSGSIANKGIAKGPAKIVFSNKDLAKVQKGDVLVAPMTTPDFVPAMEKAAAFVTDEGGILCHAAIISREMNKPCITGTGKATAMIKDNDLVEVNADNGTITILKKAPKTI